MDTTALTAGGDTGSVPSPAAPGSPAPADSGAGHTSAAGTPARPSGAAPPASRQPGGRDPSNPPSSTSPPTQSAPPSSPDTARGIAAVVGAVPITQVVIRPPGGRQINLTGPLAREIGVASGADVWVSGRRVDARTIEVSRYAVRSVDGVRAITGTLASDGDRLVLVDDDGRRHPIARPPPPLRDQVGARVWISGDLSTAINAYGVLRPRR